MLNGATTEEGELETVLGGALEGGTLDNELGDGATAMSLRAALAGDASAGATISTPVTEASDVTKRPRRNALSLVVLRISFLP